MQDLKITLIQSELYWQNTAANLAMFEEKIWQIEEQTDLIILPEMFSTGFSMESEKLAEPMNFTTFKWMKQMAEQTKAAITGSVIIKEGDKHYNRLIFMQPDGQYHTYDKRHLFRMANENDHFSGGDQKLIVEWKGWRIFPLVCYDLRFPVWSRNNYITDLHRMNFDLVLFVANWPAARVSAWDILLKARAVENLCYSAGLNRVGSDGSGIDYNGHSAIIDFKGAEMAQLEDKEVIKTINLSGQELLKYRKK
ncbi:amidohydrolase, partial [Fulvivirga sp. RKSG066]|uniref:amidohydrolase n=1 Tax=Fulvivirga aurantia TaxID=2529383 RepID=UPI0012BCE27C